MDAKKDIKDLLAKSKNMLTEENVLPIYVYLVGGGTVGDYPNKEEFDAVKRRFKELIS